MTKTTLSANSTTAVTLVEGNAGTDDSLDTNGFTLAPTSGKIAVSLNLAAAPAANGIVITNSGAINATSARAIDVATGANAASTATGAKITLNNSGTLSTSGTGKGDVFRVNFDMPQGIVIVNNTGTIKSTVNSSDSQGIRLGKLYTASQITITNGTAANTNALIQTNDADAIRAGGVDPSGSNTAYGSATITNYGKIIAQNYDGGTQLSANNAIDIGTGQSATVDNFGTIIGDESGLGADVGNNSVGGTITFAANYNVTNEAGGIITGNNGPGIASGTATIDNSGTITGKALGTVMANSAAKVTVANGTGILTSSTATITNRASGVIQGTGSLGSAALSDAISINSGTITNYGTIRETATASGNGGAAILVTGSIGSTVVNYGTISGAAGLAITMGSGADMVDLFTGGTISGTIDGGAGADTLVLGKGTGTATGTLNNVVNVETLNVAGGTWTITDAETYANGVTIAAGAALTLAASGSTGAAITDNGTLTYTETGTFTKSEAISGSGVVVQAGAGTLVLANGANSYSGGTTLASGTLDVAAAGAAGTGAITFQSGAQVLDIEQAALNTDGSFANTLSGIGAEDSVDLRGIGQATGTSFNASTNVLTVTGGSQTVTLKLDTSDVPAAGYAYGVASDGSGGTLVALDKVATVQSLAASPSNGYAKAGQTITFTIATSKAVTITGNGPVLNLSDGGTATYDAADSTSTSLVFTTTVAAGQNANGLTITSVSNGASAQDANDVPVDFSNAVNQAPVGPTVDTSAPVVAITSTGSTTNQPTQTISGTVDTADAGSIVTVYEGGNALGTAAVQSDGTWSTSINLSGNGNHTIFAQDTDAAGNVGTSGSVTYRLETNAPAITFTSTGGLTNQPTQTVSGRVDLSADSDAAGTTITISEGNLVLGHATVGNDGSWSTSVTLNGDGPHTLQASDTDAAGNTGYGTLTYNLDTTPPTVTITSNGGTTNQATQTVSGSVATADAGTTVTVYEGSTALGTAKVGSDGTWSTSVTLSGDGTHTLTATDTDAAGNKGSSNNVTYTLDTSAPSVAVTSRGGLTNQRTQTVSGTVDLADAGSTVTISEGSTVLGTATVGNNGAWTTSVTLSGDGSHTLTAADTDAAGNTGTATVTYTLDTTPPTVSVTSQGGPTNQPSQTITGRVDTADAGTTVTISEGNTTLGTAVVQANGTWSTGITLSGEGQHALTVSDTDAAGNTGTTSVTYTLDQTAPDVDITSLGGNVNKLSQVINGTGEAGTTVTLYDGSATLGTATVGADGYYHASVTFSGNGTHEVTASDTDAAGNTATSDAVEYDVDTTAPSFTKGNLVISVSGDGDGSGDYGDNEASNITLDQITTDGTLVNQLVLPTTTTTVNGKTEYAISGEYGSSSEGSLQLSGDGRSIVIAGYGVNAATYNAGGAAVYGNAAEAQSTSIQGGQYTAVARVIADIGYDGSVDTSTALFNVYNGNNPRSVATQNGSVFYLSGQGTKGDKTQGVFLVQDGATKATAINNATDTRTAIIYNGQLYVSTDSKQGTGGTSNISVYGPTLPTGPTNPTILQGIDKSVLITANNGNTINGRDVGSRVALDPNNFFFANSTTLYVADGGIPKQGGDGDGGLQKWTFDGTRWNLQYTLSQGLNIIANGADYGTTGLIGLTGRVVGGQVQLYATNQTIGDLDQKYVFSITDQLGATSGAGESFTTIMTAAQGTNIRGISFAPSNTAPVVAITSDGGLTNDATQTISGTVDTADAGTTVRVLEGTSVLGTATVQLDGTWSTNVTLSGDGKHTLTASDTDAYGNTGTSGAVTYTLDTTAPTVTIAGHDGPTNVARQALSGTGEAGSVITISDNGATVGTAAVKNDGTWSTTITLSGEGEHDVVASETDAAGNTGTSQTLTYTYDVTAPTVAITSTGGLTNDATQTVAGTVDVADAGTTVTITDGTTVLGTAEVGDDGSWSTDVNLGADGTHTLTATDTDAAGNAGSSTSVTYTLDTTAPAVAISNPGGITNVSTQTLTGTGEAGTTVTISDNGDTVGTVKVRQDGTWSKSIGLSGDGAHDIVATDTDAAGNTGTSTTITYTLDTAAPTVAITSTGGLTNDATQTVAGTVDVADAGTTVTVTDGTTVLGTAEVGDDGSWSTDVNLGADGTHTLTATDTDAAGNVGSSTSVTYTLDTTAPAVAISSAGVLTNVSTQTLTGTGEAGTLVTLTDNGTAVATVRVGTDGTWSKSINLTSDGKHAIVAADTDAAGNVGTSKTVTYTLDTTAPTVAISSAGGLTGRATQVITGTGEAGTTVTISDNGGAIGTVKVGQNGTWSRSIGLSGDGTHDVVATDTDAAGNTGTSKTVTYTLDTAAPTVSITSSGGVTNQTYQTVSGTVDVADAGTIVSVVEGTKVLGTAKVGADGTWSTNIALSGDGRHIVRATDTDAAGNTGASTGIAFTLDTHAPAVQIKSAGGRTNATLQTIAGTGEAGTLVSLTDNGTAVGTVRVQDDGTWSRSVRLSGDGTHNIVATDTDAAGNVGTSKTVAYQLDTTAPAVSLSNAGGVTGKAGQKLSGVGEAGTLVTVYDNGVSIGSTVVKSDGTWSRTFNLSSEGSNQLVAKDADAAGNIGSSKPVTYTLDTTAPNVAISNAGGTTTKATQIITGTGEAGTLVSLTDNGTKVGTARVQGDGTWSRTVKLSSGGNTIVATDTDAAGNVGTSNSVNFTLGSGTSPSAAAHPASLNRMVQAMASMTGDSSASSSPIAAQAASQSHPLAAAHG